MSKTTLHNMLKSEGTFDREMRAYVDNHSTRYVFLPLIPIKRPDLQLGLPCPIPIQTFVPCRSTTYLERCLDLDSSDGGQGFGPLTEDEKTSVYVKPAVHVALEICSNYGEFGAVEIEALMGIEDAAMIRQVEKALLPPDIVSLPKLKAFLENDAVKAIEKLTDAPTKRTFTQCREALLQGVVYAIKYASDRVNEVEAEIATARIDGKGLKQQSQHDLFLCEMLERTPKYADVFTPQNDTGTLVKALTEALAINRNESPGVSELLAQVAALTAKVEALESKKNARG